MREKMKAKDAAKALGVSTATVSLALNGKPGVNEQTRRRILEYMGVREEKESEKEEEPRKVRMIAIYDARPSWDNMDITRHILCQEEARRTFQNVGFAMDTVHFYRNKDSLSQVMEDCVNKKIEGLILNAAYAKEEEVNAFAGMGIPTVCCDFAFSGKEADSVMMNNYAGVQEGLSYLYQKEHREILYLKNRYDFYNVNERRRSFCDFMRQKGITDHPEQYIVDVGNGVAEIQQKVTDYIKMGGYIPSALFSECYETSIGAIRALESLGYHIPGDVSVLGFDAIPSMALLDIDLTSVQFHFEKITRLASKRLISRLMEPKDERIQVFIDCELVEGHSVCEK